MHALGLCGGFVQVLKFFITPFSGTVRPRRLKLGTHRDSGQMYCIYRNQADMLIFFFIFLSLQFSNMKIFVTIFSGTMRPRRLKLGTHMNNGGYLSCIPESCCWSYLSLYFYIFLSLQFSSIKNCHWSFLGNSEA